MPIAPPAFQAEPAACRAGAGATAFGSERVYDASAGQYIRVRRDDSKGFTASPVAVLHSRR